MRIGKIGHATLVIQTRELTCLTDPVLVPTFAGGINRLWPRMKIETAALARAVDAVIISHFHTDHFSVRSLDLLERDTQMFFPAEDAQIRDALTRLGFERLHGVDAESFELGDLTYTPTFSQVSFPERGMLFQQGRQSVWNMVDTILAEGTIGEVRDLVGQVDVALAPYQPLFQSFHDVVHPVSPLDRQLYASFVQNVVKTAPRCVVPSSCGFSYLAEGLDRAAFPMTEAGFLADVARLAPTTRGLCLPAGATLDVRDLKVRPASVPWARPLKHARTDYDWRPHGEIPALRDFNPAGHELGYLRSSAEEFLDVGLLRRAADPINLPWREKMSELGAVCELEVIFPSGPPLLRHLEFVSGKARWVRPRKGRFTHLRTVAAASGLIGWARGEFDSFCVKSTMLRVANRLLDVTRNGVVACDTDTHEPLCFLCFHRDSRTQHVVDRELADLGY